MSTTTAPRAAHHAAGIVVDERAVADDDGEARTDHIVESTAVVGDRLRQRHAAAIADQCPVDQVRAAGAAHVSATGRACGEHVVVALCGDGACRWCR